MRHDDEEAQLEQADNNKRLLSNMPMYFIGGIVALPTATLNGLFFLQKNIDLGNIASLNQLIHIIGNAGAFELTLASIAFIAAESLLFYLNSKYLLMSFQSVLNLIKNDISYFIPLKFFKKENNSKAKLSFENFLFIWTFMTSLIFAEIGSKTLSFLGKPGIYTGFVLNLMIFFATRFSGARMFFRQLIENRDINAKAGSKNNYLGFIKKELLGYLLALSVVLPIMASFIPVSVQGLQSLTQNKLLTNDNYQNIFSIITGIALTLPTLFFYCVAVKKLPAELFKTISNAGKAIKTGQFKSAFYLFSLTAIAFGFSYFTSVGFELVADTNIAKGYTSYLGNIIESWMPTGLFGAIVMMFWSHIQELVNASSVSKNLNLSDNQSSLFNNLNKQEGVGFDIERQHLLQNEKNCNRYGLN